MWLTILGLIAASCTTFAYLPQVLKSWKTRQTKDISLPMYALTVFGILLWLTYGTLEQNIPILFANGITLIFAGSILHLKLKNG